MGREVRRVPANWQHPKNEKDTYIPLLGRSFASDDAEWSEEYAEWQRGMRRNYKADGPKYVARTGDELGMRFTEWHGRRPNPDDYMPDWPEAERTHWQMYEDTSEGTPISPVMDSPEALARWLADSGASAFAEMTATYEQWLGTINRGWACSGVMTGGVMRSGVAALHEIVDGEGSK